MTALYLPHSRALTTLFADVETWALAQAAIFTGTGGSVLERKNASNFAFYAHQFYDWSGARKERYVAGPVGDAAADSIAETLRVRIADLKFIMPSLRLLGREGFQVVDSKTYATLAALHNRGLFVAGAFLIGSHAYGILLNRLGVRARSYVTEDIDIGRSERLSFTTPPEQSLIEILRESGVDFVEVPQLERRAPATSFKQKGRSTFQVDLLAPGRGEGTGIITVPELGTSALTLPYLGYLLKESQSTVALAREGACSVRVPLPERFAIHKLIVSELRAGRDAKTRKDREQAAILGAALAESHPGALESAASQVPRSALKYLRRGVNAIRENLENHPRAWEELQSFGS